MNECAWLKGCIQPVSLIPGEGREKGLCFYHWKVDAGRIDTPTRDRKEREGASNRGAVVSDERLAAFELYLDLADQDVVAAIAEILEAHPLVKVDQVVMRAWVLRALGASYGRARQALARMAQ